LNPKGSLLNSAKYEFVHNGIVSENQFEVLYYRIKVVDITGYYEYSNPVELISYSKPKLNKINLVNPIAESLLIQFDDPACFSGIEIKDNQGRVVLTGLNNFNQSSFNFNTISLIPGIYYLYLNLDNGSVETRKLIKL
jgi:hypothetical protein